MAWRASAKENRGRVGPALHAVVNAPCGDHRHHQQPGHESADEQRVDLNGLGIDGVQDDRQARRKQQAQRARSVDQTDGELFRIARLEEHGQHQSAHGNDSDAGAGKGEDGEDDGGGDGEAARQPAEQGGIDAQQTRAGAAFHQQIARQRVQRERGQHLRDHQRVGVVGHLHGGLPDVPEQEQRHAAQGGEDRQAQHGAGDDDDDPDPQDAPALPAAGAKFKTSGASRNRAAAKRCRRLAPAPRKARKAIIRKPNGITSANTQLGTPSASVVPIDLSETTNCQLAQQRLAAMAAVRPQPKMRTGTAHFGRTKVLADIPSNRSPEAARAAPRNAIHSVSCCTNTTEPGMPRTPARRVAMAIKGSTDASEIARTAAPFSKLPRMCQTRVIGRLCRRRRPDPAS